MNFKPGDVIINKLYSEEKQIFLILEVDCKNNKYEIFILSSRFKRYIGRTGSLWFEVETEYSLLKDKVFKSR